MLHIHPIQDKKSEETDLFYVTPKEMYSFFSKHRKGFLLTALLVGLFWLWVNFMDFSSSPVEECLGFLVIIGFIALAALFSIALGVWAAVKEIKSLNEKIES